MRVGTLLLLGLLAACGEPPRPAVEILGAEFGLVEKHADGTTQFTPTYTLPLREGQVYAWRLALKTSLARIKYTEQLTLAAPAKWSIRAGHEISPDGKSISLKREKDVSNGTISGSWGINADDPPGKAFLKITLEGGVEHRFDFEYRKP